MRPGHGLRGRHREVNLVRCTSQPREDAWRGLHMIDLDEALRADAARWKAARPALGLDERVREATTASRSRTWVYPCVAAAAVLALVVVLTWTGVFSRG